MHLRRALLLFAIVLGLAALAAALSRPADVADEPTPRTTTEATAPPPAPTVSDGNAGLPPTDLAFDAAKPRTRKLEAGRAATVTVDVEAAGMVVTPGLGLTAPADPLTPARFDVFVRDAGEYPIDFTAAGGQESVSAGTLVVE